MLVRLKIYQLVDKATFNEFIMRICALDEEHQVYNLIWQKFSGSIRLLLDNKYIFSHFGISIMEKFQKLNGKKRFFLLKISYFML